MPAPKRPSSKSTSSAKPPATRASTAAKRTTAAAKTGAKATATSTRKAASRTATQAKSGTTKTTNAAKSGAASTRRSAKAGGARSAAKTAGTAARTTARTAAAGAKGTATAAGRGAKQTSTTAKAGATRTRKAGGGETFASIADQIARGAIKPRDVVMLTRDRIQEILDDAASRGRVTRKDANDLVAELVRRGRQQSDELSKDLEGYVGRGVEQIGAATKRARRTEPVDRIVRSADRARRVARVGPSFPILGYDDLNVGQVQSRLGELSKPELRKVLTYERNNANRKSVTAALEKAIG